MGEINWLAVLLGALAFFVVGAVWYGALFAKAWQRETGITKAPAAGKIVFVMGLTFACELLIALMLGHNIARTNPPSHVIMMMAAGFGLTIMVPAIAINYLHQQRSVKLFAIDAGHLIFGMAAMGGVFIILQ